MAGKFELKKGASGKYSFNLKSGNGQVILTSQTYATKPSALAGVESVRKNSKVASRFTRKQAADGSPFFVLTATNGQTIGKSQMYSSEKSMENGIASVTTNAGAATMQDLTEA